MAVCKYLTIFALEVMITVYDFLCMEVKNTESAALPV